MSIGSTHIGNNVSMSFGALVSFDVSYNSIVIEKTDQFYLP